MDIPSTLERYIHGRRIVYIEVTSNYIMENLPYTVHTKIGTLPHTTVLAFLKWMDVNIKGYWSLSSPDINTEFFKFELKNDALMFKLRWGG
jgi:hypothetical protein